MDAPKITLLLDLNQINAILAGLGKLPFEIVAGLIDDVKAQTVKQLASIDAKKEE